MSSVPSAQRYRSKGSVFSDILRAVKENGRAKLTHILYKANLSHDRLTKYPALLKESGLLQKTVEDEKVEYSIASKGEQFLSEFKRTEQFADAFGLEI